MTVAEAKAILEEAGDDEIPVILPAGVLGELTVADLPDGVRVEMGISKGGGHYLMDWRGSLFKDQEQVLAEADYTWTRKYWYSPLGLEPYLDLVRRAVEVRHRDHGDVELTHFEDDGAYIQMTFLIKSEEKNVGKAYERAKAICDELEEVAENAADSVGKHVAEIASRVSGWGKRPLDGLVMELTKAQSSDERGRALEDLVCRLFETVPGFVVTQRVRTATEEIDIEILNDSADPRFRRESAVILAECKNWTGKCGKNEFVLFKEKIENRSRRCSVGFLISWNGFKTTVTKEILRGSREVFLVVPVTGEEIRAAVRENNFAGILAACWEKAVHI